jgi:TatA/E family protein of Tat protein translocase
MFGIGVTELGIILVVALLVFGPKRLPELARTLGRGMGEFRRASNELRQSLALDDLQNDLRRDLKMRADTIHKPVAPPTRPAQAGDDFEAPRGADPASVSDRSRPASPPESSAGRHPGELPPGNDHEHHDPPVEPSAEASARAAAPRDSTPAEQKEDGPAARTHTARPAHGGLGNVPVSDTDPTDSERG